MDPLQEYNQRIRDEIRDMKSQCGKGVTPGGVGHSIGKDGIIEGTGKRFGCVSNNPIWYQDWVKDLGRRPRLMDWWERAADRLLTGYLDEGVPVPPDPQFVELHNLLYGGDKEWRGSLT